MNTQESIALESQYCAQNYAPLPVVLERAEGVWVWDIEGKIYLDMMSAYSAVSFGHCHPHLVRTLIAQAQKLCVPSRAFHVSALGPFLEKLCQLCNLEKALPMNTGVEAVETALKAARRWGYEKKGIPPNQAEIIVVKNNFHGRTITAISFSSDEAYKKDFGPFTPGFIEIPMGDTVALQQAITPRTCAFLAEPIQGEAGIIVPPAGWLKACEQICRENNVLLLLDEIQSGLGRTGKLFAFEHEKVKPDGLIIGKALGGGILPLSAFVANNEIMDVFTPGSHGSTFGGNPLAASVGLEVLKLLEEGDFIARSATLGLSLRQALSKIKHPLIQGVRGIGLWVGVEINPAIASAREVCERLMKHGILSKEAHETVIRFAPPLIIEADTLEWAIEQFYKVVSSFNESKSSSSL